MRNTPRQYAHVTFTDVKLFKHYPSGSYAFIYMGEVPNQPLHSLVLDTISDKFYMFHTSELREKTVEEVYEA